MKRVRLFGRKRADAARLSDDVRAWAAQVPNATPIEKLESRSVARVAGAVEILRMKPREGVPAIEAVIGDGTGRITAVWLGRRAMPGVALGARLVIEGRVGGEGQKLQIINPQFEFTAH